MKPTLWTFGDSFTEGYNTKYQWAKLYIDWKGYTPKVYPEIISEKLGLKLNNLGIGGSDNYSIFQSFCDISHKIKRDDFVIFGWSSPLRFRLVNRWNGWKTVFPNHTSNHIGIDGISINTLNEILINRDNLKYVEEVNSWISLINNFLVNIKHVHWSLDNGIHSYRITNLETIEIETNRKIPDRHFSENGQFELSQILITKLMDYQQPHTKII